MDDVGMDLVTGAFGNVGRAITRRLQDQGRAVRTLTNRAPSTDHAASSGELRDVEVRPYSFDDFGTLTDSFRGVDTFYNTYWMRTGDQSGYDTAVARSRALICAAERAGVRRIVHLSVANPSLDARYPYFRAKARVEETLRSSPVPSAIIRPALIFGGDAVLLNNLAWLLQRVPIFPLPGDGQYRVRPVHVDDVARLCVEAGAHPDTALLDAVGPDRPTFRELVTEVRDLVGGPARVVQAPAGLVLFGASLLGTVLRDQLLTRDELRSTMDGLADTDGPPTGEISLTNWLRGHADSLGRTYLNERAHRRRPST